MKRVKQSAEIGFESYDKTISKVRSKKWSTPLAKTMSFTGHILKFVGNGVSFVGMLGSALTVGSKVLNPDPTVKDIIENSEIIRAQIQSGFDDISDELGSIHIQLEDLRKIAQITLNLIAELKFVEGLKRVEAYCKNVYRNKTLDGIISYIDRTSSFFFEIQTDATQHFDEDKLSGYMKFLAEQEGIEKCFEFFNYAMALRSQFLNVLVLYHSYNNELDMVSKSFNYFE
jgi:hypothetical protein